MFLMKTKILKMTWNKIDINWNKMLNIFNILKNIIKYIQYKKPKLTNETFLIYY